MQKMTSIFLAGAVGVMAPPVRAQNSDEGAKVAEAIVVTARKRAEPVEDVPFALAALNSSELEARRIDDTLTLFRQVPGLSLTSFDDGRFAYFQLRGVGPLSQAISPDDGSVVTYVDGVPQPVYASEFAYLDLERIEVLKGPQGTLYGRNAQGGAINIITRQPGDSPTLSARLEAGGDGYLLSQVSGSTPLSDTLGLSVAARASDVDGFVRNIAPTGGDLGDRTSVGGRATLLYKPDNETRIALSINGDRARTQPFFYVLRPITDPPRVEVYPVNRSHRTLLGASLTVDAPLGNVRLSSVTAINGYNYDFLADDTDGRIYGPLFGLPSSTFLPPLSFSDWAEKERRFYQELRLSSATDAATSWTVGANYFRSDFDVLLRNRSSFSPFLNGDRDNEQTINSYALFGEVSFPVASRLEATVGGRFTRDEKSFTGQFTGVGFPGTAAQFSERAKRSFNLWNGRAALTYEIADGTKAYATVALGEKSGGFPRFTLNAALGNPSPSYDKTTTISYEAGVKGGFAEGRGRFDIAAYLNNTRDEQLFILDFVTFQFLPANLDTRSYGIEANVSYRPSDQLTLSAGLQWNDPEIREPGPSGAARGNRIPNVARFGSVASIDWRPSSSTDLGVQPFVTLTHQYVGKRAADVANSFNMSSYHNIDARLGIAWRGIEFYGFARNLTDAQQEINGVLYGPGVEASAVARGRMLGIGLAGRF